VNYVHVGKYRNNKYDKAYKSYSIGKDRPDLVNSTYEHTDYHTHPSRASDSDRTQPSGQDRESRDATKKNYPQVKRFIILTKGYSPIDY